MTEPIEVEVEVAKRKVLAVYPEAYARFLLNRSWEIWPDGSNDSIGCGKTEESAWIDAASRLPAREEHRPTYAIGEYSEGGYSRTVYRPAREEEGEKIPEVCGSAKAPEGWSCTRVYGHDGPCAAMQIPVSPSVDDCLAHRCMNHLDVAPMPMEHECGVCMLHSRAPSLTPTASYTYQSLYEKRAKELAGLIVSGHYPSIDKIARLLAKEDAGR